MLNIPETVKTLYKQDGVNKNFRAHFPNGELPDITNENIVQESVKFQESVCSQDVFKFGLTEASVIEFETVGVANMYGMTIECSSEIDCSSLTAAEIAEIEAETWDGTWDGTNKVFAVPYGTFRVESCPRDHQAMTHRRVTAYTLVGGKELKNKYEEIKNELMLPNANYTPDLTQILMSTVNQNTPGGLAAAGYTENAPQSNDSTIRRAILKKTSYTFTYPVYAQLACGASGNFYADSLRLETSYWYETLMDSDTMFSVTFDPIPSDSDRVTVEEAYGLLADKIDELFEEYNETIYGSQYGFNIDLSLFGYDTAIDFVKDAFSSKSGFYSYATHGPAILIGSNIETGGPNPNALGEFSYPSVIYWPGKTYDISSGSGNTKGQFAGPVNALNIKDTVNALYPYREYNKQGMGVCAFVPSSLHVYLYVRAEDATYTISMFEKSKTVNIQTATFKRYDRPSGASQIRASFEPTLNQKKALSATKKINCFSFANAYSLTDILNGYLELSARFITAGRDGNAKIIRLENLSPHAVAPGEYSQMWWDEYDVDPIGTVRYAYTDEAGEEQIKDYKFGDGASVYDMTDNAVLKAMDGASPDVIEAMLDALFVPHLSAVNFTPIDLSMKGLPFLEAGDALAVTAQDGTVCNSYALRQEIDGIQSLTTQIDSESGLIIDSEEGD